MNNIQQIHLSILFVVIITFSACKIDPHLNDDPNNPTDVPVELLMAPAQVGTFFNYGN